MTDSGSLHVVGSSANSCFRLVRFKQTWRLKKRTMACVENTFLKSLPYPKRVALDERVPCGRRSQRHHLCRWSPHPHSDLGAELKDAFAPALPVSSFGHLGRQKPCPVNKTGTQTSQHEQNLCLQPHRISAKARGPGRGCPISRQLSTSLKSLISIDPIFQGFWSFRRFGLVRPW